MIFSEDAAADLDEIWTYTFHKWGEAQADSYVAKLRDMAFRLSARPRRAHVTVDGFTLYRARAGSHYIFYSADEADILIVRILHTAMDSPRHLSQS